MRAKLTRRHAAGAILAAMLATSIGTPAFAADMKVGANVGNVPWEFQDEKGDIVGFEVDLAKEIGKRLNMNVTFVNIPFNGLFAAVQSGQVDAAVSSITITKKRLESVSFAQPYYDSDQSLAVRSNSGIKNLDGMANKVAAVDTGSTGDMWSTQNQQKYKFSDIRRYEGLAPAMLDLAAGRIDGYISDIPAVQYYIKDKPAYQVVERILTGEQYSMMFAKNSPLAEKVNAEISKMKQDGLLAKIHEKWFGAKAEPNSTTVKIMDMPKL
ncbi:transporter substrate-binding domain-containing protein [Microvirga pudoricolor]|uniref:transporter substrate-binding domain-containing protein n=1 Tax=Microvirga pudoricolor TaxID=2778729 RepID=UPI001950D0B5|nr:transporter substrate-binding domain-containing protein [Microvirga pudoricolor]